MSVISESAEVSNVIARVLNSRILNANVIRVVPSLDTTVNPAVVADFGFNVGGKDIQRNAALSGIPTPLTGNFTIGAEQIIDGNIVVDTSGGNVNMTLDTAANIIAQLGDFNEAARNTSMRIINRSLANTFTLITNTGIDFQVSGRFEGTYIIVATGAATVRVIKAE